MSLIRQVWALLIGAIVFAVLGSVVVSTWGARAYLQTQLAMKNADNAQSLALTLSQQGGDAGLIELALAAQFDIGHYRSIRLHSPEGKLLFERVAPDAPPPAPAWFMQLVPLESAPGLAEVSAGWTPLGRLEVISQPVFAYGDLWRSVLETAAWMLLVALGAAAASALALRRWRRPLDQVIAQAEALSERRFVMTPEPATPELRTLARAMNHMVERVHAQLEEQAAVVEQLRRTAHIDPVTGLAKRSQCLAQLQALLADERVAGGRLVLLRLLGLAEQNRRHGHADTDAMLAGLAEHLRRTQPRALGFGRLNGSDLALLLPPADDAANGANGANGGHTADGPGLLAVVREALSGRPDVGSVVAVQGFARGQSLAEVLAAADAGLARAESRGVWSSESRVAAAATTGDALVRLAGGEQGWRRELRAALEAGRTSLGEFAVCRRDGSLLHLECPLRLQLRSGEQPQVAAAWLPYAIRTGLMPQIDLHALQLALEAIERDGRARCVSVSPHSLAEDGFITRFVESLRARPQLARRLWVEVDAHALGRQGAGLAELARQLRALEVKVGIEHAGERGIEFGVAAQAGLDYVKLAQSLSHQIGVEADRLAYLRGLVATLRGLGVLVIAEGVLQADDLAAGWAAGLDAATGPALGPA